MLVKLAAFAAVAPSTAACASGRTRRAPCPCCLSTSAALAVPPTDGDSTGKLKYSRTMTSFVWSSRQHGNRLIREVADLEGRQSDMSFLPPLSRLARPPSQVMAMKPFCVPAAAGTLNSTRQ